MKTLTDEETGEVTGGVYPGGPGLRLGAAYMDLLGDMEKNPQKYTWLMDWYYGG